MRRGIRWLILGVIYCLAAAATPGQASTRTLSGRQAATKPLKIQVIVIGVTEFKISTYNNDNLTPEIKTRCDEVEKFFKDALQSNVSVTNMCVPEKTNSTYIKNFFLEQYPKLAERTLTMVFLITHAEIDLETRNEYFSPNLRIVTSSSDGLNTKPRQWRESTISSVDLMSWLANIAGGSTVVAFLDTCYSGSAFNGRVATISEIAEKAGIGMYVMSSAAPQTKSYKAAFTAALLDVLKDGSACITDASMPDKIYDKIVNSGLIDGKLTNLEGIPQTLVRYKGGICLGKLLSGSSDAPDALLMIYGGSTTQAKRMYTVYRSADDSAVMTGYLNEKTFDFVRLSHDKYKVIVSDENGVSLSPQEVNLVGSKAEVLFIDDITHPQTVAKAYQKTAEVAEQAGLPPKEVSRLKELSAGVYAANNNKGASKEVLSTIDKKMGGDDRLKSVRAIAFKDQSKIQNYLNREKISKQDLAELLVIVGDFKNAALLFEDSLADINDPSERTQIASLSYYSYGAAGETHEAQRVRTANQLQLKDSYTVGYSLPMLEGAALKSKGSEGAFRSMATINAIIEARKLEALHSDANVYSAKWQRLLFESERNSSTDLSTICPDQLKSAAPECITSGGRFCLIQKGIDAAVKGDCQTAFKLAVLTQCHDAEGAAALSMMGAPAVCEFLTNTSAEWMGETFWMGFSGARVDFVKSRDYFLIAASKGNARAMANLGWIYENGFGTAVDYPAAMGWYLKASERGDAVANWNIGRLYQNGLGVQRDLEQARIWYKKGADLGEQQSRTALSELTRAPAGPSKLTGQIQ